VSGSRSCLSSHSWKTSGSDVALNEILGWSGSEKLLVPLLVNLVSRISESLIYEFVTFVLASPNTPPVILVPTARTLLRNSISEEHPSNHEKSKTLLSQLRQRYPDILESVSRELTQEDEEVKEKVEQIILSLSLVRHYHSQLGASIDKVFRTDEPKLFIDRGVFRNDNRLY